MSFDVDPSAAAPYVRYSDARSRRGLSRERFGIGAHGVKTPEIVSSSKTEKPVSKPEGKAEPPDAVASKVKSSASENYYKTGFIGQTYPPVPQHLQTDSAVFLDANGLSEDRIVKLMNKEAFLKAHSISRKRAAIANYPLSGATLAGIAGFLLANGTERDPLIPTLASAVGGAVVGFLFGQFVMPWMAKAEARAMVLADDVGVKTLSYSSMIDRDGSALPGSELMAGALFGNVLFSGITGAGGGGSPH